MPLRRALCRRRSAAPCLIRLATLRESSPGRTQVSVMARRIVPRSSALSPAHRSGLTISAKIRLASLRVADAQGLKDCLQRRHGIALDRQHFRQTVQAIAVLRPDDRQLPVDGAGLLKSSLCLEHRAKIAERLGEIRRQGEGLAGARLGVLELAQSEKRRAQIVERLGIIRLERQRLAISRPRPRPASRARTAPCRDCCAPPPGPAGAPAPGDSWLRLPPACRVRKAQCQDCCAPRPVRLQREHLAVTSDSFVEAPRLMMPDRLRKQAPGVRRCILRHAAARAAGDLRKTAKTVLRVILCGIIPRRAPISIHAAGRPDTPVQRFAMTANRVTVQRVNRMPPCHMRPRTSYTLGFVVVKALLLGL